MRIAPLALLTALAVGSCASGAPKPPPNAGTLIVKAVDLSGPAREGSQPTGPGIANAPINIHTHDGQTVTSKTDKHGIARLTLAPGTYTAELANVYGDTENAHGDTYCPEGAAPATVILTAHGEVSATLTCSQIG